MKKYFWILILGLIVFPQRTYAAKTFQVQGIVRLPNQRPAFSATVELVDPNGKMIVKTITDSMGTYQLTALIPVKDKPYSVAAELPHYGRLKKSIPSLKTPQTVDLTFSFFTRVDFVYLYWPDGDRSLTSPSDEEGEGFLLLGPDSDLTGFRFDTVFSYKSAAARSHKTVGIKRAQVWAQEDGKGIVKLFTPKNSGVIGMPSGFAVEPSPPGGPLGLPLKGYRSDGVRIREDRSFGLFIAEEERYALIYITSITKGFPAAIAPNFSLKNGARALYGRVVSEDGFPLRDASVHLLNKEGQILASALTDKNGYYIFAELKPDLTLEHWLSVGHENLSDSLTLLSFKRPEQNRDVILFYPRGVEIAFKHNPSGSPAFGSGPGYKMGYLKLVSDFQNGALAGVDIKIGQVVPAPKSMVYVAMDQDGKFKLFVNDLGGGGILPLGKAAGDFSATLLPKTGYKNTPLEIQQFHAYAIYDAASKTYGFIRFNSIKLPE